MVDTVPGSITVRLIRGHVNWEGAEVTYEHSSMHTADLEKEITDLKSPNGHIY